MAREVRLRGGLDAVGVIAVVDGVQVAGEDLVLRPAAAELDREARLLDLALEGALAAGVQVADELLRDRRSAFDDLAGADVAPERAGDPDVVDAAVLVEAAVLDRDRGRRQPARHPAEADGLAVPLRRDRAEERSVRGVDERVLTDRDRPQRAEITADGERRARTEAGEQGDRRDGQGRAGEQRSGPPATPAAVEAVAPVQAVLEQVVEIAVAGSHRAASGLHDSELTQT